MIIHLRPVTIECPRCGVEVILNIICMNCGFKLEDLHKKCRCGKPVGHGRHRIIVKHKQFLAYQCACGFTCTTKEELDAHLKELG